MLNIYHILTFFDI